MNTTIESVKDAQAALTADFEKRMAALRAVEEAAAAVIAENATLEAAETERQQRQQEKAESIDSLNDALAPILTKLDTIREHVTATRERVTKAHQTLKQAQLLQSEYVHQLNVAAIEVAQVAAANATAFDSPAELQQWVQSKLLNLIPLGATSVAAELPPKVSNEYGFRGFGLNEQGAIIRDALNRTKRR